MSRRGRANNRRDRPHGTDARGARERRRYARRVPVLLAALGMLGVSLDSAVNVALPTMAASFAIGPGCCPESREAARGACHRDGVDGTAGAAGAHAGGAGELDPVLNMAARPVAAATL